MTGNQNVTGNHNIVIYGADARSIQAILEIEQQGRQKATERFKTLIEDKTKWFVGRTYVFDAIQSFIDCHPNGYFTITGDPGQGKSAILAKNVRDTGSW